MLCNAKAICYSPAQPGDSLHEKDYTDKATMQGFIDMLQNISEEDATLAVDDLTTDDQFITLYTCTQEALALVDRYMVVARLVEEI